MGMLQPQEVQYIQEKTEMLKEATLNLTELFKNPDLSSEEHDLLINRFTELRSGQFMLDELFYKITDERRAELHEKIDLIQPNIAEAVNAPAEDSLIRRMERHEEGKDIQETSQALAEESKYIIERFSDPDLSSDEQGQLLNRVDEIQSGFLIMDELLLTDGVSDERRAELHKQLDIIQPNLLEENGASLLPKENDRIDAEDLEGIEVAALLGNSIIGQQGDINHAGVQSPNESAPNISTENTNTMLKI